MKEHRTFGERLVDHIEKRNGNRLRIANRKVAITNARDAWFHAHLAQRDRGSNLMQVLFGQPFRVGSAVQKESVVTAVTEEFGRLSNVIF